MELDIFILLSGFIRKVQCSYHRIIARVEQEWCSMVNDHTRAHMLHNSFA